MFFTAGSRRIGPAVLNGVRLVAAVVLLSVTHRVLTGHWVPDAAMRQVAFLAVSGLIGLTIGDQALFTAFVHIGPRLAMLCMTASPIFASMFAWVALGETLGPLAMGGVALVIAGVAWVVLERPARAGAGDTPYRWRGVGLALIGAACQAGGLLLSKQGMGHGWLPPDEHLAPQAATLVRMVFATAGMAPLLLVNDVHQRRRRLRGAEPVRVGRRWTGYVFACCGAVVGPFLGVWMSLEAANRINVGVAQALCSLTPVFVLPVVRIVHSEPISLRAVLGAIIAVAGAAMLFIG